MKNVLIMYHPDNINHLASNVLAFILHNLKNTQNVIQQPANFLDYYTKLDQKPMDAIFLIGIPLTTREAFHFNSPKVVSYNPYWSQSIKSHIKVGDNDILALGYKTKYQQKYYSNVINMILDSFSLTGKVNANSHLYELSNNLEILEYGGEITKSTWVTYYALHDYERVGMYNHEIVIYAKPVHFTRPESYILEYQYQGSSYEFLITSEEDYRKSRLLLGNQPVRPDAILNFNLSLSRNSTVTFLNLLPPELGEPEVNRRKIDEALSALLKELTFEIKKHDKVTGYGVSKLNLEALIYTLLRRQDLSTH